MGCGFLGLFPCGKKGGNPPQPHPTPGPAPVPGSALVGGKVTPQAVQRYNPSLTRGGGGAPPGVSPGWQQAVAQQQAAAARQAAIVQANNQQAQQHAQDLWRQIAQQNAANQPNFLPALGLKPIDLHNFLQNRPPQKNIFEKVAGVGVDIAKAELGVAKSAISLPKNAAEAAGYAIGEKLARPKNYLTAPEDKLGLGYIQRGKPVPNDTRPYDQQAKDLYNKYAAKGWVPPGVVEATRGQKAASSWAEKLNSHLKELGVSEQAGQNFLTVLRRTNGDPFAAANALGIKKTKGGTKPQGLNPDEPVAGLSGDKNRDAQILLTLDVAGADVGRLIRRKFVPIPGQASPTQPSPQRGPQESDQEFQKRVNDWYTLYASKFMEALRAAPKDPLSGKPNIDQAKQFAAGETMSGLDPATQNAIRAEQLHNQQADITAQQQSQFNKQLQKEAENPLGLPGILTKKLPGVGLNLESLIPGINVADIAARTLKQKEYNKELLSQTSKQADLMQEAQAAKKKGDEKLYRNRRAQAEAMQGEIDKLRALSEAQAPPELTPRRIAAESLLAGASYLPAKGIVQAIKGGAIKAAGQGIARDFAAGPLYGTARTAGQLAVGTAGSSLGAGTFGAGYAALAGEPNPGEVAKQFAIGALPFGVFGLAGVRNAALERLPQEKITPQPESFKQSPIKLNLSRPEKSPKPGKVEAEPGSLLKAQKAVLDMFKPESLGGKIAAPFQRVAQELYDPAGPLVRIDRAVAKKTGKPVTASESLSHLYDMFLTSDSQARARLRRTGAGKVFNKYQNDPYFGEYLAAKHGLEVAQKRGMDVLPNEKGDLYTKESLAKLVTDYEQKNPQAKSDAKAVRVAINELGDRLAAEGTIPKADWEFVKNYYKDYFPFERIAPEGVEKPKVDSSPTGSIGRDNFLREIEGPGLPVDATLKAVENRVVSATKELNRARLAKLYAKRVEEGHAPGKITQTAEGELTRKGLLEFSRELTGLRDSLKPTLGKNKRRLAVASSQRRASEQAAASKARAMLRKVVQGNDARAAIGALDRKGLLEVFDTIFESREPGSLRIGDKLQNSRSKETALRKEISDIRDQLSFLREKQSEARQAAWELKPDSTTGKPTISGLDSGGVPFRVEVPPDVYRTLQGLGRRGEEAVNLVRRASSPFRSAFTGWLNPLFTLISFVFYDPAASAIAAKGGARALISPKSIRAMLSSFRETDSFRQLLVENGLQESTASLLPETIRESSYLSGEKGALSQAKSVLRHPKQASDAIDSFLGKFMQASRIRVAEWTYRDSLRKGMTKEQAVAEAVQVGNNAMPNYVRVGRLAKVLDAGILYTAASLSGTRTQLRALRNNPGGYAVKLATFVGLPAVLTTAHNLSSEEGKRFYDDMIASGKEGTLDFNYIIVLPGAHKDEDTGQWVGIIKLPVPPEFRSLNRAFWRQTRDIANHNGLSDPRIYAGSMFDYLTGQISPIGWTGTSPKDKSLQTGVLKPNNFRLAYSPTSSNPILTLAGGVIGNTNLGTGGQVVPEELRGLPKSEQVFPGTRPFAKWLGGVLHISPLKAQYIMSQFGLPGRVAQNITEGQSVGSSIGQEVSRRFIGAKGISGGQQFFLTKNELRNNLSNPANKALFDSFYEKSTAKTVLDSAERSLILLRSLKYDPELWSAVKALNDFSKNKGQPHDPLFDDFVPGPNGKIVHVTDEMRVQQLVYASSQLLTQAKQSYSKEGKPLYTELGLEQPNQQALYNARGKFFAQLGALGSGSYPAGSPQSLSGAPEPTATPPLGDFQNQYFGLPKGTGQRKRALQTPLGQQMLQMWKDDTAFTNKERAAIGLKPLKEDLFSSGGGFGRSGGSRGRRGGGRRARAGKTIRIKKGRAGKKVTFKKNKITPFVLPKTKKKSLTFQQILKQLS